MCAWKGTKNLTIAKNVLQCRMLKAKKGYVNDQGAKTYRKPHKSIYNVMHRPD